MDEAFYLIQCARKIWLTDDFQAFYDDPRIP
jgi:hypothetical protein